MQKAAPACGAAFPSARLGVDVVVGTAVVGSLSLDIVPGSYVVLDQFLDFTKKTPHTVYDGDVPVSGDSIPVS